jgi:hypothetical protein
VPDDAVGGLFPVDSLCGNGLDIADAGRQTWQVFLCLTVLSKGFF